MLSLQLLSPMQEEPGSESADEPRYKVYPTKEVDIWNESYTSWGWVGPSSELTYLAYDFLYKFINNNNNNKLNKIKLL